MERQKRRVDIFGRKLQSKLFIIAVMEQVARSAIENDKKDNVLKINKYYDINSENKVMG